MDKKQMVEFAELVATAVVTALEKQGLVGTPQPKPTATKADKTPKTAYQKTEQLLFNYEGFKRIISERKQEITDIRKYGVPQKSAGIVGYTPKTGSVGQIVLPEEAVDAAVRSVEASVEGTVQVVALMDKCMATLKGDPYYDILPMRYFEGRTLEDIGVYFGCDHTTISRNKSRLVRELSLRLFPDEVVTELMK